MFPLICSDFLHGISAEGGATSAAVRIRSSLRSAQLTASQKLLVTGCSHTVKPGHGLWDRALTHIVEQVHPTALIAVVNGASCLRGDHELVCSANPIEDAWRNRTGVYKPIPVHKEETRVNSPLTLATRNNSLEGVVARRSSAMIIAGIARWTRSVQDGAYLWHVPVRATLNAAGVVAEVEQGNAFAYEIVHTVARRREAHRPKPEWAGSVKEDEKCRHCSCSCRHQSCDGFLTALCGQEEGFIEQVGKAMMLGCDIDVTHLKTFESRLSGAFWSTPFDKPVISALEPAVDVASLIWASGATILRELPGCTERAVLSTDTDLYLVWSSPWLTFQTMWRSIDAWRRVASDAARLLVLGRSGSGDFDTVAHRWKALLLLIRRG